MGRKQEVVIEIKLKKSIQRKLILIFFTFLSFYATLGSYPLFNLDEGAFSEATREMLVGKDFITTYLNGELRFDKPILIYWLQALSASIFGLNEFAMRLPSAIAATIWAFFLYIFTRRWFGEEKAFWATFFMVGSLHISIIAKAAIADALLNLFIVLSLFTFYNYYRTRKNFYLYISFAAVALGTLTKGPIAILIPLAVGLLFLKDFNLWLKTVFNPVGLAIFFAITAPWYVMEYLRHGDEFIQGFFIKHNINRFKSTMEGHSGGFFYYVLVILVGLLPFTSIFLKSLTYLCKWFNRPLTKYLAIWFLFVFAFFSFSSTKLPHYLVYGYTPLFILMSLYVDRVRTKKALLLPYMIFVTIFFALPFGKDAVLEIIKGSYEYYIVEALDFSWGYILFFAIAFLAGIFAIWRLKEEYALILASFFTIVGVNFFIAKTYANAVEEPIKEAALFAKEHNLKVVMEGINAPSFAFYYQNITPRRSPKEGEVVFTKITNLKNYKNFDILFAKNAIVLLKERR
ncbi:MAG: glycosyltransferase family 39 protein [Epsilonproteobacteria bacterium]|nr:glycosyltransferase family 39 protein [Campylobacterota bacterium]